MRELEGWATLETVIFDNVCGMLHSLRFMKVILFDQFCQQSGGKTGSSTFQVSH